MPIYSADFETTTNASDCRVWAWGYCDIENPEEVKLGNSIDSFMGFLQLNGGIFYFHNLKFDGNFILYWLFKNGYTFISDSKKLTPKTFSTLISDMGTWYTITIQMATLPWGDSKKVEIRDSLKIIPLPVDEIPEAYGLEENKLKIDYNEERPVGHTLTDEETLYIRADIIIVAKALKFMRDNNQKKLTSASNALYDFKSRFDKKEYNRLFPAIDPIVDRDIRLSYKGGWTYLNPKRKNEEIKAGQVFDVNSMYPWAMKYCLLPYGNPYYFSGEYVPNSNYPLYVTNFLAEFKLKPGKYPSIQLKKTMFYGDNEYIEESLAPTVLTLTSVDYELFLHNYDVNIIEFYGGYMFKAKVGMFSEYVDYWYAVKTDAKKHKNPGMEKISKLMLNSLYGKFGSRLSGKSKIPYFDTELNKVRYKLGDEETRKGGYLPVATFITSYCRDKIVRAAEICGDRFIYADTDSVHIEGTEPVPGLDVDKFRLGAFKQESIFVRAKFIRQKTYLEVYNENGKETYNLKCCGMPQRLKNSVTEEDFYEGAIYDSNENPSFAPKLMPKVVPGGVILEETTFQIKKTTTVDKFHVVVEGEDIINAENVFKGGKQA